MPTITMPKFAELPDAAQRAFSSCHAEPRQFPAGAKFYKFTQHSLTGSSGGVSPWWSGVEPLGPGDPGLAGTLERAERLGVAPKDFVRAQSAVTNQWNSMDGLLVIRLRRPVAGFVGRCAHQPMDQDPAMRNVLWIGGAWQAYLPDLSRGDVEAL